MERQARMQETPEPAEERRRVPHTSHASRYRQSGRRRAATATALVPGLALLLFVIAPRPAAALSSITIVDASRALAPLQGDYETGYVESTAPSGGIQVRVTTDNAAGVVLYIRVKGPTAGGVIPSYTPLAAGDQAFWSTGGPVTDQDVDTDVRVANLWAYEDAGGAGTADYVNTVTYTVVEP
jgi:hypothetical protein